LLTGDMQRCMADSDIIIITVAIVLITISAFIIFNIIRSGRKEKILKHDDYVIKAILNEFNNRIDTQNKRMADLLVRTDLFETRLSHKKESHELLEHQEVKAENVRRILKQTIPKQTSREVLSTIEVEALRFISPEPRVSKEVQDAIHKSREHTARLLKELYERGYLGRESKGRYFVYSITEEGRKIIG
jgi:predicted transcriptional regulator